MTPVQRIWSLARKDLAREVTKLGYPEEFADLLAGELGSPKAIDRMASYLALARPGNLELNGAGDMQKLAGALSAAGFPDGEIEKIFWKNALRVYQAVLG